MVFDGHDMTAALLLGYWYRGVNPDPNIVTNINESTRYHAIAAYNGHCHSMNSFGTLIISHIVCVTYKRMKTFCVFLT
jgi:hypothetical protein